MLDIGAGTGPCVEVIARALPQAQIIAVEPSPAMRAALTSRLLAQPDLQQRVTVQPRMLQQVTLPPQLAAVVCCGVIGYFDSATRQQLWHDWARRLAPGGVVIADVMMIDRPQPVPRMQVASVAIGEHEYQIWIQGEPADEASDLEEAFFASDAASESVISSQRFLFRPLHGRMARGMVGTRCLVSYCSSFSFSRETQASVVHAAVDRHTQPTFTHTNKTSGGSEGSLSELRC